MHDDHVFHDVVDDINDIVGALLLLDQYDEVRRCLSTAKECVESLSVLTTLTLLAVTRPCAQRLEPERGELLEALKSRLIRDEGPKSALHVT